MSSESQSEGLQERLLGVLAAAEAYVDFDWVGNGDCSGVMEGLENAVHRYRQAIGRDKVTTRQGDQVTVTVSPGRPATVSPEQADKKCTKCGKTLPVGDYPIAKAKGKLYRRSWCRPCLGKYYREHVRGKAVP